MQRCRQLMRFRPSWLRDWKSVNARRLTSRKRACAPDYLLEEKTVPSRYSFFLLFNQRKNNLQCSAVQNNKQLNNKMFSCKLGIKHTQKNNPWQGWSHWKKKVRFINFAVPACKFSAFLEAAWESGYIWPDWKANRKISAALGFFSID